jgi:hypothetical protein
MGRVTAVLVAGVVAVSAIVAAPAVAAMGGNSANAHACQQGGHENRFEAETGDPFKNTGDCASHGAQGGATALLQIATTTYPCGAATCWGTLSGSGLPPGGNWVVFDRATGEPFKTGVVDPGGNVAPINLVLPCGVVLQVAAVVLGPPNITSAPATSPCS